MTDTEKLTMHNLLLAIGDHVDAYAPKRFQLRDLQTAQAEHEALRQAADAKLSKAISDVRAIIA